MTCLRRGAVGIAHAEVDDVLAARPRRRLHRIDFGEDVGRQALDAVEIVGHRDCGGDVQCGKRLSGRRQASLAPGDGGAAQGEAGQAGDGRGQCRRERRTG